MPPSSVTASAPTRIDLAGGTIDIWPLYLFHDGASTLNAAISLRAHATIEPRSDDGLADWNLLDSVLGEGVTVYPIVRSRN